MVKGHKKRESGGECGTLKADNFFGMLLLSPCPCRNYELNRHPGLAACGSSAANASGANGNAILYCVCTAQSLKQLADNKCA
ncbi:hypothetical protein ACLKA6_009414 [Drosophila palustris]